MAFSVFSTVSSSIRGPSAALQRCAAHAGGTRRRGALATLCIPPTLALMGSRSTATAATTARNEFDTALDEPNWPKEYPFRAEQFDRYDDSKDELFYDSPRFVTHIDDNAIKALTKHYEATFPKSQAERDNIAVLDLCSSWISHYPKDFKAGRVVGLGMNKAELDRNSVLTEVTVQDLNDDPTLPYADESFDFITNAVSVDYLTKPLAMFREMHRVLKPGGTAIMSFSNRCFPTKAISIWTSTGDIDHLWIVGSYYHYSVPDGFTAPVSKDITLPESRKGRGDPMFVVQAQKLA